MYKTKLLDLKEKNKKKKIRKKKSKQGTQERKCYLFFFVVTDSLGLLHLPPPLEATEWSYYSPPPLRRLPYRLQLRPPLPRLAPHQHLVLLLQRLRGDDSPAAVASLLLPGPLLEELIGQRDLQRPRGRLADVERPDEGGALPGGGGAGADEGGGKGDEGEHGVEEVGREQEVGVPRLELVAGGEWGHLLADEEGVGAADEVAGVLLHELGRGNRAVVDPDTAVAANDLDSGRRGRVGPGGDRRAARGAHEVQAPRDHLQTERLQPHFFVLLLCDLSPHV
ncbi:hypothetical protein Cni_G10504 [Canna indica]|uniref:Uncharacterized protein n=1 Tax=Canna indica TaxID=4628 RepID=A0AAQ3K7T3_9LILI|nr:hypothetical protein Cni_G10504 [Canna indica]